MPDRLRPVRVEEIKNVKTLVFPEDAVLEETERHWVIWKNKARQEFFVMISKADKDTFGLAQALFHMMGEMAGEKFDAVRLPTVSIRD